MSVTKGMSWMRQQVGFRAKQNGNDISPSQMTSVIMLSHITHRSTSQIQNQRWRNPSQNTLPSTDHTDPMSIHWTMIARTTQCPYSDKPKHLWVPSKRKRLTSADVAISPRFLTYISYTRNRKGDIQVALAFYSKARFVRECRRHWSAQNQDQAAKRCSRCNANVSSNRTK